MILKLKNLFSDITGETKNKYKKDSLLSDILMSIHGYINKHQAVSIGWPFPNFQKPRFQNEAKVKVFHVKITFICMLIKN